jgi:hypothetical protein
MFGQVWLVLEELPGLAWFDGDGLAYGDAVAACAMAKVPSPPPNSRLTAITIFAIRRWTHERFLIVSSPPGGDWDADHH